MTRKGYRHARKDYPEGVVAVYDNGGRTLDRYTVVYRPYIPMRGHERIFPYVAMSGEPFHPQGFCQHGEVEGRRPTHKWGGSIGRVIAFEELPADCQRAVERDLEEEEGATT